MYVHEPDNLKKIKTLFYENMYLFKIKCYLKCKKILIKKIFREQGILELSKNDFIITVMILFCFNYGYTYVKINQFQGYTHSTYLLFGAVFQEKCDHYWPPHSDAMFYGDLQVAVLTETRFPSWSITEMKIAYVSYVRTCVQTHCLSQNTIKYIRTNPNFSSW